jgi:hypothetical protein
MRDAQATFFVGQHGRCGLDGVAFGLGTSERSRPLKTVLQDQPMHITHVAFPSAWRGRP